MNVELIYDRDCPNVVQAREQMLRAFAEAGQSVRWTEWDRGDESSPAHVRQYGSPTILVNGVDVAGALPSEDGNCCRIYRQADGTLAGVPDVTAITGMMRDQAASNVTTDRTRMSWKSLLAAAPGIGIAFLPKLACPACWPAYASLLSAVGLGFLLDLRYLLPLTIGFLVLALGALAYKAQQRHGYGPFVVGLFSAAVIVIGKFVYESDLAMYIGVSALIASSVWNAWPTHRQHHSCVACDPQPSSSP